MNRMITFLDANPRLRQILPFVILGVLLLVALVLLALLVSRRGVSLPVWGSGSQKAAATQTPLPITELAVATSTPAPPTITPIPTLLPNQVVLSGPSQYGGSLPYVAEYAVTLTRGDALTLTVSCTGCLWENGTPILALSAGSERNTARFRASVLPGSQPHFSLSADGAECLDWELLPGDAPATFQGVCIPLH